VRNVGFVMLLSQRGAVGPVVADHDK